MIAEWKNSEDGDWPKGEWSDEIDKRVWTDTATGYTCMLNRHPYFGHLCGYVAVPMSNPLFWFHYDAAQDIRVHGGMTFNLRYWGIGYTHQDAWSPGSPAMLKSQEPVNWLGFDCAHYDDLAPGLLKHTSRNMWGSYKSIDYVTEECASLAKQAKETTWVSILKKTPSILQQTLSYQIFRLSLNLSKKSNKTLSDLRNYWLLLKQKSSNLLNEIYRKL